MSAEHVAVTASCYERKPTLTGILLNEAPFQNPLYHLLVAKLLADSGTVGCDEWTSESEREVILRLKCTSPETKDVDLRKTFPECIFHLIIKKVNNTVSWSPKSLTWLH